MKQTRNFRPPFIPDRDFVASRSLPVNGRKLGPGAPFPRNEVSPRRLRQLFDRRCIQYAPGSEPTAADLKELKKRSAKPGAIGPQDLKRPGAEGQPGNRRARRLVLRRQPPTHAVA